ncbi:MAG: hypothetical protein WD045_01575 [Pirellulaceae bacterium]
MAEFSVPSASLVETQKTGLTRWWKKLRSASQREDSTLVAERDLVAWPKDRLDQVAPPVDWSLAVDAFDQRIAQWLDVDVEDSKISQKIVFLIGPPHSGRNQTLTGWAERRELSIWPTPDPETVWRADSAWLERPQDNQRPWVLPELQRCFFRHADGLTLVRGFLDMALSGKLGRGVIGCDSWAWAYLQHIWHFRQPATLSLAALDAADLAVLFGDSQARDNGQPIVFKQSDTGRCVIAPPSDLSSAGESCTDYLKSLAATSRGNVGIASAIWRMSLRRSPEGKVDEEKTADRREFTSVWVRPLRDLELPEPPGKPNRDVAFILHALLLHDGLSFDLLEQLLPLSPSRISETLVQLESDRLLQQSDEDTWRVSPTGYLYVREFLHQQGYLVDSF